jgi:Bacterial Ig-like domain/WD40-like Beta Propeller Repeat
VEGLRDEKLDDKKEHEGDEDGLEHLEQTAQRTTHHKFASIGAVLSSCPVELPKRLGWLKSARALRFGSALVGIAVLAAVLYNATAVDRVPPTYSIQLSNTVSGSGLALVRTSIKVAFSEEVNPDIAQNAFSITPTVAGSFHWQGRTLIFTPSNKLPLSSTFHVHMAPGVQDLSGNVQNGSGDVTFTTVGPPVVESVVPDVNAQRVSINTTIAITFDRLMDTQKSLQGLAIEPTVPYSATWQGAVLTLTPTKPLEYDTVYTIKLGAPAVDQDGSKLAAYVTSFRTIGIGLRALALYPTPNVYGGVSVQSKVAVVFDGPVDPASIANSIQLAPPVSGSVSLASLPDDSHPQGQPTATPSGSGSNVLVFTPSGPLAAHTSYTVTMSSGVRATDGQAAAAQTWTFTTGEPSTSALGQIAFLSNRSGVNNLWLMNSDGTDQRQVTSELVPVTGFDISGDGTTVAYAAAGVVKVMGIGGDIRTTTAAGRYEYAPAFTADGTGLIVGRRDAAGTDLGYWRIPVVSGADQTQILPNGAPLLGSVELAGNGLTGSAGLPSWASRAAFSQDDAWMLIARGSDNVVELVGLTGAHKAAEVNLIALARPVWVESEDCFYLAGSDDNGRSWAYWRVSTAGVATRIGPSVVDLAADANGNLVLLTEGLDGSDHLEFRSAATGGTALLTTDPGLSDRSPSFSPDGKMIVFGRVNAHDPTESAGIWAVRSDSTGLAQLSPDGAYTRWVP